MRQYLVAGMAVALAASQAHVQAGGIARVSPDVDVQVKTIVITNGAAMGIQDIKPGDMQAIVRAFADVQAVAGDPADATPTTWLGVSVDRVAEEVRAQVTLPSGAGLVVRSVTDGSPSAKAGVQVNDILVKLDDQLLMNPPQLQALVQGKNEGDQVTLTLMRKGKEMQVKASLVKKELGAEEMAGAQVIDLGTFDLDLKQLFGQIPNMQPVVIKSFSCLTNATSADAADLQKTIQDAVQQALKAAQQQAKP